MLNAPELAPGLEFYFHAFVELTTERQVGMSEGPIPVSAMRRYAEDLGLSPDEAHRFRTLISGMDVAYLRHRSNEAKK